MPPKRVPAFSCASIILSIRLSVTSNGFSQITCLPALAAAMVGSAWKPLGVAMVTTSIWSLRSIA